MSRSSTSSSYDEILAICEATFHLPNLSRDDGTIPFSTDPSSICYQGRCLVRLVLPRGKSYQLKGRSMKNDALLFFVRLNHAQQYLIHQVNRHYVIMENGRWFCLEFIENNAFHDFHMQIETALEVLNLKARESLTYPEHDIVACPNQPANLRLSEPFRDGDIGGASNAEALRNRLAENINWISLCDDDDDDDSDDGRYEKLILDDYGRPLTLNTQGQVFNTVPPPPERPPGSLQPLEPVSPNQELSSRASESLTTLPTIGNSNESGHNVEKLDFKQEQDLARVDYEAKQKEQRKKSRKVKKDDYLAGKCCTSNKISEKEDDEEMNNTPEDVSQMSVKDKAKLLARQLSLSTSPLASKHLEKSQHIFPLPKIPESSVNSPPTPPINQKSTAIVSPLSKRHSKLNPHNKQQTMNISRSLSSPNDTSASRKDDNHLPKRASTFPTKSAGPTAQRKPETVIMEVDIQCKKPADVISVDSNGDMIIRLPAGAHSASLEGALNRGSPCSESSPAEWCCEKCGLKNFSEERTCSREWTCPRCTLINDCLDTECLAFSFDRKELLTSKRSTRRKVIKE